jgi:hypothetical protein
MFKAILLICVMGDNSNCIELHDQRGPYETRERCVSRIHEMGPHVHQYMPGYHPVSYKCNKLGKGKLA